MRSDEIVSRYSQSFPTTPELFLQRWSCLLPNPRLSDQPPVVESLPTCLLPCSRLLACLSALLISAPRLPDYLPADEPMPAWSPASDQVPVRLPAGYGTPSLPNCLPFPELWPVPVYSACPILIIGAINKPLNCPVTIVSLCTRALPNPPVTVRPCETFWGARHVMLTWIFRLLSCCSSFLIVVRITNVLLANQSGLNTHFRVKAFIQSDLQLWAGPVRSLTHPRGNLTLNVSCGDLIYPLIPTDLKRRQGQDKMTKWKWPLHSLHITRYHDSNRWPQLSRFLINLSGKL